MYLADTKAKKSTISQAGIGSCNDPFSAFCFGRHIPPFSHGCDFINGGSPILLRPYHVPNPRMYWSIGSVTAPHKAGTFNKDESMMEKATMNKVRSWADASDKVTTKNTDTSGSRFN